MELPHLRPDEMEIPPLYTKPRTQKPTFFVAQVLQPFGRHCDHVGELSYQLEPASFHWTGKKTEIGRIQASQKTS